MKWYQSLCIACGIAFLAPSFASAQPMPPAPPGQPGMHAPAKPGAPQPGKKPNDKKDDKAKGPQGPQGRPGMAPEPNHKPDVVKPIKPGSKPAPMSPAKPAPKPAPMSPAPKPAPAPASHSPMGPAPAPHGPMGPAPAPHGVMVPPPPAPHNPMMDGMHPHDFDNLVHSVKRANFKADKISRIKVAARSNHFTSRQVKDLMLALDFDSDRVEAACTLYPVVVDRANWFIVLDALTFSSNRYRVEACSR